MKPVWIKYYGIIPMTKLGYLFTLAIVGVFAALVVLAAAVFGTLPPLDTMWSRQHHLTGWRRHLLIRPPLTAHRSLLRFSVRPDFVFRKQRLAIFVDGCFWHACPKHSNLPVTNRPFWRKKLAANRTRDLLVTRTLCKLGWRVLRLWEHELATKNQPRLLLRLKLIT